MLSDHFVYMFQLTFNLFSYALNLHKVSTFRIMITTAHLASFVVYIFPSYLNLLKASLFFSLCFVAHDAFMNSLSPQVSVEFLIAVHASASSYMTLSFSLGFPHALLSK